MTAQLLDGRAAAAAVRTEMAAGVKELVDSTGIIPLLANVMGGDDAASAAYARSLARQAERAGMGFRSVPVPAGADDAQLRDLIRILNDDAAVHGVIVQVPLPPGLTQAAVAETLDPRKDVDGITPTNAGRLVLGQPGFVPSTPLGGMELLRHYHVDLKGKNATVVGRSAILGKPMALLLLNQHATVTVCHSRTPQPELEAACRRADVLCAATGRPGLIRGEMVKPGAVLLDFGTSPGPDGALVGDVDFAAAAEVAGWISPVPGGTGVMTTAVLLRNTLAAARALLLRP